MWNRWKTIAVIIHEFGVTRLIWCISNKNTDYICVSKSIDTVVMITNPLKSDKKIVKIAVFPFTLSWHWPSLNQLNKTVGRAPIKRNVLLESSPVIGFGIESTLEHWQTRHGHRKIWFAKGFTISRHLLRKLFLWKYICNIIDVLFLWYMWCVWVWLV